MKILTVLSIALAAAALGGSSTTNDDSGNNAETPAYTLPGSSVVGGVHDFSTAEETAGGACRACHVPHKQAFRPTTQPTATQPSFEVYRIPGQRRVFVPDRYMPGPTSLVCLGCHDGTIATSTIGSAHAMLAGVRQGFDMPERYVWRDHPIGVAYPSDIRDYRPQSFVEKQGIVLPEGRIECISCHDPHEETGLDDMLVISNRKSALCLTCHIK
jgi:predicted CXXCH cytochrome family protein